MNIEEKLAEQFKIARKEGEITKWADGVVDAKEAVQTFREHLEGVKLPKRTFKAKLLSWFLGEKPPSLRKAILESLKES